MASPQQARRNVQGAVSRGSSGIILGVLTVLVLALLFVKLTDDVVEQEHLAFDQNLALWIHSGASATQTAIMLQVTELGKNYLYLFAIMSLIIGGYITWRARRGERAGVAVAVLDSVAPIVSVLVAASLSYIIKALVGRTRPHLFPPLTGESGPSFPSGHTITAVAFYGMCAFLLARPLHGWALAGVWAVAIAISGAVAYSRVYLGVHYPTDVLGSFLLGTAWIITLAITLTIVQNRLKGAHLIQQAITQGNVEAPDGVAPAPPPLPAP
jgi:undecaprenyl-diphosphatase